MFGRGQIPQLHFPNKYTRWEACLYAQTFCRLQGDGNDFRLLIQRPHATAVFSGDFDNGKSRADPLTALQRTFVGSIVPLEVFAVNNSTLSPNKLCQYLQKFNPGKTCGQKHLKCRS